MSIYFLQPFIPKVRIIVTAVRCIKKRQGRNMMVLGPNRIGQYNDEVGKQWQDETIL